jgi:hypothetical protein
LSEIVRGCPAPEEVQRFFGACAGFSGVGEEGEAGVRDEIEPVVAEGELADGGMVEVLDAGVVEADVVGGPAGAERVALGCEFADEV